MQEISVSEERLQCLFCLRGEDENKLHCFSVLETDRSTREMALNLKILNCLVICQRETKQNAV